MVINNNIFNSLAYLVYLFLSLCYDILTQNISDDDDG